jgi:CHAT domain-containing protein/Flp pilus assembly protein TadD
LRQYLLGQLTEADEEKVELRLLTEADYAEELDIIVDELIDQYVEEEGLAAEERKQLEQHFFKSSERVDKLKFALALKRQRSRRIFNKYQKKNLLTFYLPIAASVLIVIGLSIGAWRTFFYQSDAEKGLVALQTAYRNQRPVEARVSDFNYAPTAKQRGGQANVDYVSRDRAAKLLLNAVSENPSTGSYHALGKYYLAERQFDKAIDQFNAALSREPQNAQVHSDLGATLLEKGKSLASEGEQGEVVEEFAQSLDQLNKALELDDSLREALFNRALLYEQMILPRQAEDDWRSYLEKDQNSEWADEARQNLRRLEEGRNNTSENKEEIYRKFLGDYHAGDDEGAWRNITLSSGRVGNYIVERLVDDYLNLTAISHRSEAIDRHRMLQYIGAMKEQRAGDLYASALARFYQPVTREQAAALIRARNLMELGQKQIASAQFTLALKSHTEARQLFERAGNEPESRLAEYWIAVCQQQLNDKEQSALLFQNLAHACERENYRWLLVRSLNGLAYHEALLSEFSKAIKYSLRSWEIAEQTSETYGKISALSSLMQNHLYLGNRQQSLSHARRLLASGFSSMETKQRWVTYNEVAWTLSSLGLNAAAADYQKVALQLAQELQEPSIVSLSFVRLGVMYGKVSNYDEAFRNIQQAFKSVEAHSGEPFAQHMTAYASLHLGNLYRQAGQLDKAIASFNSCIDIYGKLNLPAFVYQARKGKLLSLIAANDIPAAQEELNVTLSLYEEYRSRIAEESHRNSFFDLEHEVFDVAVDFAYSTIGDRARAFEYLERSQARSLLARTRAAPQLSRESHGPELITSGDPQPLGLSELQSHLPEQVQILQYAVLESRVLIWVVSRRGFETAATEIAAPQLKQKIEDYLQFTQSRDQDKTLRAAKDLYSILIRPVEPFLDRDKQVYVVPDKILVHVPFGALISPTSERYMIQDYLLAMSPSSNIFLFCTRAAGEKGRASEELLLGVGNPAFDRREFPDLSDLPSSAAEVNKIADFYNPRLLFVGKEATKEKVTDEIEKADVIHLASHAITDERSPLRSKLLLARGAVSHPPTDSNDGVLQASEVYEFALPRARLVVLSACQTGSGPSFRGEGVMSMARPFLARGVPLVVASLWAVDSDATAELMVNFHRYRKREGYKTIEALQRAQLDMLNGPRELYRQPYYWASFNLIGGYAEI